MICPLDKKNNLQVYSISFEEVDCVRRLLYWKPGDLEKKVVTRAKHIPVEYHEFLLLFESNEADCLAPHCPIDHTIPHMEGNHPPYEPFYGMLETDLKLLRENLEKNLSRSSIYSSTTPAGSPILLAKNGDRSLVFCVDYRGLNAMRIMNRYPFPLI